MNETYFVCFQAGTSGRFVSSIVWNLINDIKEPIEYSDCNSAHLNSYWTLSWDHSSLPNGSANHQNIYDYFKFTKTVSALNPYGYGLLNTHVFPNFNVIGERFPDTKIILIKYDIDDIPEINLNNVLKNKMDQLRASNLKSYLVTAKFVDPIVPENFKNKTLILGYKELFEKTNNGYLGLDKLCSFTKTTINDIILQSYSNYAKGRESLLEKYESIRH